MIDTLCAKHRLAKSKRQPFESGYQDCYDYALPGRTSFFARSPGDQAPEIYDETAVVAVQEFSSRIQQGLIPNFSKWCKLAAGSEIPEDQRDEVDIELEKITEEVFTVINSSNFAQEANECLIDIAIGTACMEVREGDAVDPVIFNAVPLPELAMLEAEDDSLGWFFRSRMMRVSDVAEKWKGKLPAEMTVKAEANQKAGKETKVEVVRCVYREPGPALKYKFYIFLPKEKVMLEEQTFSGIGASPLIGFRWSKAAGEVWGRGPLFNVMPAVRTANLVVQMILENAEMAIAGVYTAEDDGVVNVNNIRLNPGTVIPVAPGSRGLQAVGASGSFDVSQLVLGDMRNNIKRALFNEQLGSPDTTPMSATEVQQRMADLARQIGAAFGRLQVEFVNRVIQRVIFILKKQNRISVPVVNGREVKIVATSPLAQAQAVEDINAVNNWLGLINQHYGPQVVQTETDSAHITEYLADKFGVPARLKRSDESKQQLMQSAAALMQQQGGEMPNGPQGSPI